MALSKDQILSSVDRETKTVDVPEWGGEVILKTLTGIDRSEYDRSTYTDTGDKIKFDGSNLHAKLLGRCIVDEDGNRVFNDKEIANLGTKSAGVLSRLYKIASEMNGIGKEAEDDAKGNSDAGQTGDSSSD